MSNETNQYEGVGNVLRGDIKSLADKVWGYIRHSKETIPPSDDNSRQNHSEMIANAKLAYRHLEDARMRIGKCLQAYGGGVSIYDKPEPVERASAVDNACESVD